MEALARFREAARRIKQETMTVYFVARDPRTPLLVRLLALLTAAYALSPIDLIPDFIPVLGYLDDLILLPLGIILAIKLTPPDVVAACRAKSAAVSARPVSNLAAALIVAIWIFCAAAFACWLFSKAGT